MQRSNCTALVLLLLSLSPITGCSAPAVDDDDDAEASALASSSACSRDAYAAGLTAYKDAVRLAKARAAGRACEEGATQWDVGSRAADAVAKCGDFRKVLKSSPYAAPVRAALKETIALPALTGDLRVKDARGELTFEGLKEVLSRGVTMWGPATGAYGNTSRVDFAENGAATVHRLTVDDDGGNPRLIPSAATYAIGAVSGGKARIVVTEDGAPKVYELSPSAAGGEGDLLLTPQGAPEHESFTAYVSECEA